MTRDPSRQEDEKKDIRFFWLTVSNAVSRFLCGETELLMDHLSKVVPADEPSAVIAFPLQYAPEALRLDTILVRLLNCSINAACLASEGHLPLLISSNFF